MGVESSQGHHLGNGQGFGSMVIGSSHDQYDLCSCGTFLNRCVCCPCDLFFLVFVIGVGWVKACATYAMVARCPWVNLPKSMRGGVDLYFSTHLRSIMTTP